MAGGTATATLRAVSRWILGAALTLCAGTASGALVGDAHRVDPILATLVDALHPKGIDVVGGDTSEVPLDRRPRVALLSGVPNRRSAAGAVEAPWMREFRTGAMGFVAALGPSAGAAPVTVDDFLNRWNAVSRDKRVFLSFTRADAHLADAAAEALRSQGYVTFTFLKANDSAPAYDPTTVGALFADAGHHFVIDTPNARKSEGVWLESKTLASIRREPPPEPPLEPTTPGPPRPPPEPGTPPKGSGQGGEVDDLVRMLTGHIGRPHPSIEDLKKGIREGHWVVTKNPQYPDKIFIHESQNAMGGLRSPLYVVKVEPSGLWSVFEPKPGPSGIEFGRRVGMTSAPASAKVGSCGCR